MASRRRSNGFLAKLARVASAGALLPALVAAAALVLGGCGGDDSSDEGANTTAGAGVEADGGVGTDDGKGNADGSGNSDPGNDGGSDPGSEGDQKEGPGVAQPEGEREPGITPQQRRNAISADIRFSSPVFSTGEAIPGTYTCDGKDSSPPLQWSGVPDSAAELVLLVLSLQPVEKKLFFNWAVAGIDPALSSIEMGQPPLGAVVGENSFGERGYSICPSNEGGKTYVFMLYALPTALDPEPGFDPLPAREAVIDQASNVGIFTALYAPQ